MLQAFYIYSLIYADLNYKIIALHYFNLNLNIFKCFLNE